MRDRNAALPVPAGRPSKLTAEVVQTAREISEQGGALDTVARACKASISTIKAWMLKAERGIGSELENQFLAAIQEGRHLAEIRAIKIITGSLDPRDAQWWLTHNPTTRETWSDAAADRRVERKTIATVMDALASAGLTPDDERRVLLQIQARGLGTPATDEGEG